MKAGIFFITCFILCFLCTGCTPIGPGNPEISTATANRNTSLEYSLYMNKQITVYINQISSRMTICRNISEGNPKGNEVELADESLKIMQDIYDEVSITYPSIGADDDKQSVLMVMETAMEHVRSYRDALLTESDVKDFIAYFQNDFNQLTGLANLYYE